MQARARRHPVHCPTPVSAEELAIHSSRHSPSRRFGPSSSAHREIMMMQRTVGNRAVARWLGSGPDPASPRETPVVQRYVTFDDRRDPKFWENMVPPLGFIPLNGYWVRCNLSDPNILEIARLNYNDRELPEHPPGTIPVIQGDINRTNNSTSKTRGCGAMVASDYLGMNVGTLLESRRHDPNPAVRTLLMQAFNRPNSDQVEELFEALSIRFLAEDLDNYEGLLVGGGVWTGALAWEGHVVRASGRADGALELWDPQGGLGEFLVPTNRPLKVYTFS